MPRPLKVLLVEDNPVDAELVVRELRRAGFEPDWHRVETESAYRERLTGALDIIISDFEMPQFGGLPALELLNESGLEVPLIIVSGTIGEDTAVAAMRRGAADYLLKDRLARLGPSVDHAMTQGRLRRERKNAEESLRLFRNLMDQSDDTLEIIDPVSARFLDVNIKGPADLGCTREEYLAMRIFDIDPTIPEAVWPHFVARIREAGSLSGEGLHRRRDGTTFPVEFNARWVHLDRDFIVAVVRDISVRRKAEETVRVSEQRFRELAENIHEVFWITDPVKNEMLYVSPAFERIWDRTCQSLYDSPHTWIEAIRPEDRDRIVQAVQTKQVKGTYDEEYRIIRPDGSERWIRDRAFPVSGDGETIERIVGIAEDITERKRLEQQFLHAQRMEAIGTLASGIAHDLNNILAPMLMGAGLLKEKLSSPRDINILGLIETGAQRGTAIIRQLLTFGSGVHGEKCSVQPRHLIKEIVNIMTETFPKNIRVEQECPNDIWTVEADATQLHQILINLCVNSRDAMPAGGTLSLRIQNRQLTEREVGTDPQTKPGPHVMLTVADTGHGIPPGIIKRIFDPFFTTKGVGNGTGLGLSTVIGIVRNHGGFVRVYSESGKGAAFHIYLPAEGSAPAVETAGKGTSSPLGSSELILVVDDEAPIREAAKYILENHGYRVITAANGEDAIVRFVKSRGNVRLLVTDIMMPLMDGPTLVHSLRVIDSRLKVIASSGLGQEERRTELQALGIAEFLVKPYESRQLLQSVHRMLAST